MLSKDHISKLLYTCREFRQFVMTLLLIRPMSKDEIRMCQRDASKRSDKELGWHEDKGKKEQHGCGPPFQNWKS